jgi:glycosyltransferase involved in cell wall biosynthesis
MHALLREFRPDVVHAHKVYPQLSVAPVVVAKRAGLPIVQTLHDYEFMAANPLDARGARLDRRESRSSYRALNAATFVVRRRVHVPAVDEWIAVSDFVAAAHVTRGISSTVIANFADVEAAASIPASHRQGIAFLGTLSLEKGAQDVLRLAEALPEFSVVVAGRGPLEPLVRSEAERLPNLDFRGQLDPLAATELVRSASVVVVPSRWEEPGALVALEAMAVGTPVVAYRRGGLSEYVTRGEAGLVVDADPRALVEACGSLVSDRDLWSRCSEAGLEATRTLFSRDAHTAAVLDVYARAVRRR